MTKNSILTLICALVFMLPAIAKAGGEACTRGELEWTFDPAQDENGEYRTGRLHGTLEAHQNLDTHPQNRENII